jgi:hypothetical protein
LITTIDREVGKLRVKKRTPVPLNDYGRLFDVFRPLSARVFVTRRSAPQLTSGQRRVEGILFPAGLPLRNERSAGKSYNWTP